MQILGFFFFSPSGAVLSTYYSSLWVHCEECTLRTVIVKQVNGDEESNARKIEAFVVLEG